MADRKRGPVKPPTIDLSAREAGAAPPRRRRGAATEMPKEAPTEVAPADTQAELPPEVAASERADGTPAEVAPASGAADTATAETPDVAAPAAGDGAPSAAADDSFRPADLPRNGTPSDASAESPAGAPEPAPAAPPPVPASAPVPALLLAALGGGVLALVLAYGLALVGLWPAREAPSDPRIEEAAAALPRLAELDETAAAIDAANARIAALEADLAARLDTAETGLDTLRDAVENLPAPADAEEVAALGREVSALSDRIDAVASGAGPDEAAGLAAALGVLRAEIEALTAAQAAAGARIDTADEALAALRQETLDAGQAAAALAERFSAFEAEAAIAPGPEAVEVPLLLSSLESALAAGRPFAAELTRIATLVPGLDVDPELSAAARAGLPRPDQLSARFTAAVPAMLGAAPGDPDAPWQDQALDRLRALFAIRPAGEVEGDAPEAVVARLEAALARQDFGAAEALFAALPAPMRAAAGDLPEAVAAHARAAAIAADARTRALSPGGAETTP